MSAHLAPTDLVDALDAEVVEVSIAAGRAWVWMKRTRARRRFCVVMDHTTTFDTQLGRVRRPLDRDGDHARCRYPCAAAARIRSPTTSRTSCGARSTGMTAVLAGDADDLLDVALDHRAVDPFRRDVYAATREIRPGTTTELWPGCTGDRPHRA